MIDYTNEIVSIYGNINMLEDSRRELIALSGVPAPYLGYGDKMQGKIMSPLNKNLWLPNSAAGKNDHINDMV